MEELARGYQFSAGMASSVALGQEHTGDDRYGSRRDQATIVTSPVSSESGCGKRTNVDLASDEHVPPFRLD
jgi:hypothetical protein